MVNWRKKTAKHTKEKKKMRFNQTIVNTNLQTAGLARKKKVAF